MAIGQNHLSNQSECLGNEAQRFTNLHGFQLLDHEPRASNQVPLLLSMKADKLALFKALDSGDTDLGSSTVCIMD